MEVEINGKKYTVLPWGKIKVGLYDDLLEAQEKGDKKIIKEKQVTSSTGMSKEEYDNLTVEDREKIYQVLLKGKNVEFL